MPRITEKRSVYQGKLVQLELVTEARDGEPAREREVVRHAPGVAVVVLLDQDEEGVKGREVLLIKHFRPPLEREITELVAGLVDEGEQPLEAAQRELREETGLQAAHWIELGTIYSSPGFTDEAVSLFLARQVRPVEAEPDSEERIHIYTMPYTMALEKVREKEIQDAKTVAGLLLSSIFLEQAQRGSV